MAMIIDDDNKTPVAFDYDGFTASYANGEKPLVEALMGAYTKPEKRISPEQEKKARTAAAISDGLASLAEIAGYSSGVKIRNRSADKTSTQKTADRIESLKDKYEQDMLRYNTLKSGAIREDFASQLRSSMNNHNQNVQHQNRQAEIARLEAEAAKKRDWQIEDEERKRKNAKEDAEWTRDNVTLPQMREQGRIYTSMQNRVNSGTTAKADKNIFEISVPEGTSGSEYDQYTGRWYKKETISPERQQSIISNLPDGKANYINKHGLYREQISTDAYGQSRTSEVPWSDADVVKFYLENDYKQLSPDWRVPRQKTQQQQRGTVRGSQQSQQQRGSVR